MEKNERKLWMYYLLEDDEETLYAFTEKKSYAKRFEQTRDMKLFYRKVCYLDKEEFHALLKDYRNHEMVEKDCVTKNKKTGELETFFIILTAYEGMNMMMTEEYYLHSAIYQNVWTDPYIFNDYYRRALRMLSYTNYYNFVSGNDIIPEGEELPFEDLEPIADDFAFLTQEYGRLFKWKKGGKK